MATKNIAGNGITLSSVVATTGGCSRNTAAPVDGTAPILVNGVSAVTWNCASVKTGMDLGGTKLLTLLATGIALASHPALSQGAMGQGGPTMAPQSRTTPTPQAPRGPTPQGLPTADSGDKGAAPAAIYGHNFNNGNVVGKVAKPAGAAPAVIFGYAHLGGGAARSSTTSPLSSSNGKAGSGGPTQEPSRAPLPSGYAYDANGRIGFVGDTGANGKTGSGAPAADRIVPKGRPTTSDTK